MIITCPNCATKYNLDESKIVPNAKLRCTVCKHVFDASTHTRDEEKGKYETALPTMSNAKTQHEDDKFEAGGFGSDEHGSDEHGSDDLGSFGLSDFGSSKKNKKSSSFPKIFIFLIFLLAVVYALGSYTSLLENYKHLMPWFKSEDAQVVEASVTEAETKLIYLRNVRQYNINNEKLGKISVIEGKAVNGFDVPKELIKLEAILYDDQRNVLVAKQQLAGTTASLFQLQVLSESELDQALGNKIDILANNTNLLPGQDVSFMIVFFNPPENASEFGVRVIDAKDITKPEQQ